MNNLHHLFFTHPRQASRHVSYIKPSIVSDLFSDFRDTYPKEETSYKLYEEEDKLIFKCLAPSVEQKDLDLKIDAKSLSIKLSLEDKLDLYSFNDINLKFKKEIDTSSSYAQLDKGVLTVTMPIREELKMVPVKFI